MLKIVRSGFGGKDRHNIAALLRTSIESCNKCYLIVPEQQTVMAESEMALLLPKNAPLYFEATNFTRFADTVLRALGGLSGEYCDSGKRALIMWRALTELAPTLSITSRGEVNAGIVDQSLRAVAEMENLGITPDALARSGSMVSADKRLSDKLSDISKIYTLYKSLINERYSDSNDAVNFTVKRLWDKPDYLRGANVIIDGFTSFTEAQYALIARLAARCSVTVYLPIPKGDREGFEFKEILRAENRLKTYAAREGADVSLKKEDGRFNTSSELLSELPYAIWKINPVFDYKGLQNKEELRIFEAQTPFEECDFVASDIRRRVMDGAKYSDFAIIARSADKYTGVIDGSLSGADIPFFTSTRTDVSSLEAVKLIYTAFAIIKSGFRREDVITYAKCGFSGISREECDELEIYADVWQINGRRFTDGIDWNMNPAGYSVRKVDGTAEKLKRINDIRYRLIEPLMAFSEDMRAHDTVRAGAEALMRFLIKIRLEHRLRERVEYNRSHGDINSADEAAGIWKMIITSLDSMVEVMGDLPSTPDSFLSQMKALFSYANLGRIPSFVDQVTIGSADMIRLSGKKHVYLIGVNAGEFPASVAENSYFSDSERLTLAKAGLDIEPELEVKNARELFCFSRAMAAASESVTILYTTSDAKFKRLAKSDVIDKITKLTLGEVTPIRISSMSPKERLYSATSTINALDTVNELDYKDVRQALINSGWNEVVTISEGNLKNTTFKLGKELTDLLYGKRMALTQSRLDSYADCPMAHFLKYTVRLDADERAEFDAPSIGSFIHGCLENFFKTLREKEIDPEALERTERERLTREAAEKYLLAMGEDVKATRTAVKIKRLTRAAIPSIAGLCDEFKETKYRPKFFELEIKGGANSPDPIRLTTEDGKTVYIYGIIDRVDTYEDGDDVFVRVIDYKTGSKDFNPDDMEKGRNLQMFLYLKAIMESDKKKFKENLGVKNDGRVIPGGVIYIKTSLSDTQIDRDSNELALEEVKKNQAREGMTLEGDIHDAALGKDYIPGKKKRDSKKYRYSEEGFNKIMENVEASVINIAEGIRSGNACSKPDLQGKYSPCEFCDFKPICRNAKLKKS